LGGNTLTKQKAGRTWVYSDPHFYHQNICKFTNDDGTKVRPWDDAEKMTNQMINWYNEMVHPEDRVYILGDVAFSAANMEKSVGRMNGRKVLVPGNHDPVKMRKYFHLFDDVRGYVVKKGFIMSHIPIHSQSLSRWQLNIHGHLHNNQVMSYPEDFDVNQWGVPDERYYCACVERTNFRPILLDTILKERGIV
jgi:calcineurin-like phosphoesterase family protein